MKTLFQDIFFYFARFCNKEGVKRNFTKKGASEAYNEFYKKACLLPIVPLIDGIDIPDFVLAASEETVKKRIMSFKGTYLFVDFGEVSSSQNQLKVQEDEMRLAVTVARPLSVNTLNIAEEIVLNDELFSIITAIRDYMKQDRDNPFIKRLTFPLELQPFNAPALANSFGWTMVFTMKGVAWV